MEQWASLADRDTIENGKSWQDRNIPVSIYKVLSDTTDKFPDRNALSFQILSDPKSKAETLTWRQFHQSVTQAANLFRQLGIGENDVVSYVLPNCTEAALTLIAGATAGIANPINALLDAEKIASILNDTKAKVVVTIKSFPKTDVAQKVAQAVAMAPGVTTVLEVDLLRYLSPPKSWIVPLIRPKNPVAHHAKVLNFRAQMAAQPKTLQFAEHTEDRVGAYFHTGGTTGMPKIVQHTHVGMIYNGWLGGRIMFTENSNIMCPLPLFHVFACHVIFMAALASGAHVVFPTPAGYRGDGVFDNFWKLIERWKITFIIIVPTAIAALMQRPVDADISSVKIAFSGSAPLPAELFRRFEKTSGVTIVEGYGLTEATCLVSCNPISGAQKIGSVGIPFPYSEVRILHCDDGGEVLKRCETNEIGEICVANPGVNTGHTYTQDKKNAGLYADGKYMRTGDLGRIDEDGFLWITGRAKDLIIRGGHNIDPNEIEEALAGHQAIAFVGAIGQPDAYAGELPCAYVELIDGGKVNVDELLAYAKEHIHERAVIPKYIEIVPELPKTAVGKIFKPDLRKMAIKRVYSDVLAQAGLSAKVVDVVEDKRRGLTARIAISDPAEEKALGDALGGFTRPWKIIDASQTALH